MLRQEKISCVIIWLSTVKSLLWIMESKARYDAHCNFWYQSIDVTYSHRAMFKLGAKNSFLLCLLIKKKSAVYSADRCNFSEPETDCSRNENNLYKSWVEGALNSGSFGHFRFANHLFNWQILIKVWTSVIGLSCLIRTILEYEKVRQIWTLFLGPLTRQVSSDWLLCFRK